MTTPSDQDTIPQTGFDPVAFWLEHKSKVIIYGALLIIAALSFADYQISTQRGLADARQALAKADSADDYRQIVQKFPHSIAAGDASLLLAEKLRNDKKYDEAIAVLQAMIDNQPTHPLIDAAWLSLACTYNAEDKPDKALDTYQQTATKFADRFSAPQALLAVAEILKTEGKLEEAKIAYENVKSQFPDSYFASEAIRKLQSLKK
jgi:TolA-binding protein